MEIIGILGFKNSGKDTAAQPLLAEGFKKYAFADTVKDILASAFCWDRNMLEGSTKESREWREQVDSWWAKKLNMPHFTPRFALTNIGTDVMRKHFHDDIWILNTLRRIEIDGSQQVVFTDCRFPNEAKAISKLGGKFIQIQKGDKPAFWTMTANKQLKDPIKRQQVGSIMRSKHPDVHESEWIWNHIPVDVVITNDNSISDLHRDVMTARNSWKR